MGLPTTINILSKLLGVKISPEIKKGLDFLQQVEGLDTGGDSNAATQQARVPSSGGQRPPTAPTRRPSNLSNESQNFIRDAVQQTPRSAQQPVTRGLPTSDPFMRRLA